MAMRVRVACLVAFTLTLLPSGKAIAADADTDTDAEPGAAAVSPVVALTKAVGDDSEAIPQFDKLRTPDSPAFVLLGVSPTQIDRPNTPKQLAIALGSFVSRDSLTVPDKLAVEFAPYWIWNHPRLTLDDYARHGWGAIVRDFTVSVGTATTTATTTTGVGGTPTELSNTDLAIGIRTHLFNGDRRASCYDEAKRHALDKELLRLADLTAVKLSAAETKDLQDKLVDERAVSKAIAALEEPPLDADEVADIAKEQDPLVRQEATAAARRAKMNAGQLNRIRKRFVDDGAFQAEVQRRKEKRVAENAQEIAKVDRLFAECADNASARLGWLWDVAGAAAGRFPGAQTDDRRWLSWAAWTTAAYEGQGASIVLLARFAREKAAAWRGFADVGARGIVAHKDYAASVEAIVRRQLQNVAEGDDPWFYRVAVSADYLVFEGSWLAVSFGKDFGTRDASSVFTLANLKWGFGKPVVTRANPTTPPVRPPADD